MTGDEHRHGTELSADLLAELSTLAVVDGLALLEERDTQTLATAASLAHAALIQAETAPASAARWLEIAVALNQRPTPSTLHDATSSYTYQDPALQAQVLYAQARLCVGQGKLQKAEDALTAARTIWEQQSDQASLDRSALGYTQILAMQGRHAEAESVIRAAIASLSVAPSGPQALMLLEDAQHNLATLLLYQERNREALDQYQRAEQTLEQVWLLIQDDPNEDDAEWHEVIEFERAHANLNRASALMSLDQLQEAEELLASTHASFEHYADRLNRGRTSANLGSLFLRTGRYAGAVAHFEAAAVDLLGENELFLTIPTEDAAGDETKAETGAEELERLRLADTLLLEQAMAYIALNLRREATASLRRCEALFRSAQMPYELGQTLWASGRLRLDDGDFVGAEAALSEAEKLFVRLQNVYWQNRTRLAIALLAYRQGAQEEAQIQAEALPVHFSSHAAEALTAAATTSDIGMVADTLLLRLRLALERGDLAAAGLLSDAVSAEVGHFVGGADAAQHMPHIWLRILHARGQIARASGQWQDAQRHFYAAISLLEEQRTTLALEEMRTAYLDDKVSIYRDLILALIDAPRRDMDASESDILRAAFDAVERARSRALLERLSAIVNEPEPTDSAEPKPEYQASRLAEVRQELHWLYNRLLGDEGSRNLNPDLSQKIKHQEELLGRLEMRLSPVYRQAQPEDLTALQDTLSADEQALVFYIAGAEPSRQNRARHRSIQRETDTAPRSVSKKDAPFDPVADSITDPATGEVMVFLVDRERIQLFRHLCSEHLLVQMQDDLRFQMGRAELGEAYIARHGERIQRALHSVLHRLYTTLIGPIADELHGERLLIVPYGALHLLPFHILWSGGQYMIERFELSYVPSASIAIHCERREISRQRSGSGRDGREPLADAWAGLAVTDPAIPQAPAEVMAAATSFANAQLFLEKDATRAGLRLAAQHADILHIATHGLFRADNPFFSALKLDDGWINVREIYQLPLVARLVVLSACDSGLGRVRGGDELIGLVRGFFGAGAQGLIASLWTVNDASAARLMQDFYHELTAAQVEEWSPARALRAAQKRALARGEHPYFWASFYMVGR